MDKKHVFFQFLFKNISHVNTISKQGGKRKKIAVRLMGEEKSNLPRIHTRPMQFPIKLGTTT